MKISKTNKKKEIHLENLQRNNHNRSNQLSQSNQTMNEGNKSKVKTMKYVQIQID